MTEAGAAYERHLACEYHFDKMVAEIAVSVPFSFPTVRRTAEMLRVKFNDAETLEKTREACRVAAETGTEPDLLVKFALFSHVTTFSLQFDE